MTIGKIKEFVTDTNEIKGKTWNPHGSLIDEHQFHWLLDKSIWPDKLSRLSGSSRCVSID